MLGYFLYALTGILAGTLAGLFGVGGGVIVVPALVFIYSLAHFPAYIIMHMAIGTSLAAMVSTAVSSVISHHRREAVLWPLFWQLLPGLIIGTVMGAILASSLQTLILRNIFGIFLLVVALRMFLRSDDKSDRQLPGGVINSFFGALIGFLSGMLGIGGGAVTIPLLHHYGVPLPKASGTSAAVSFPIAITGAISVIFTGWHVASTIPHATGYIYWPAAIIIGIFSVAAVSLGSILALRLPVALLQKIFAVLLIIIAADLMR